MNIVISVAQTKQNLINIINSSQLPLCILREIMQNLTEEIATKAQEELQIEIKKQKEAESESANKKEE